MKYVNELYYLLLNVSEWFGIFSMNINVLKYFSHQ